MNKYSNIKQYDAMPKANELFYGLIWKISDTLSGFETVIYLKDLPPILSITEVNLKQRVGL